jgi:proton-coupled amino acid transporter
MLLSSFLGSLKLLMPVSLTANVIMWIGIVLILYFSSIDLPPITDRDLVPYADRLPLFFGIVLFAFEGIPFVKYYVGDLLSSDCLFVDYTTTDGNEKS